MFRKGLELDWLCPSVLLYLVAVCPPIWILELKMADIRCAVCIMCHHEPWCVNINLNILTRRERLCLYYQLIVGEVDGCDEKATPTPRVYLLLELMQVPCLVIALFHSLCQWIFFTQVPENSHPYFLGMFSLSLSTKVFTLFHMFLDVMLRFVRVWRCLWAGPHKHFKRPRLHQQGQGYQASRLWLPSFTWINRSMGWHKWTSWRRFWTSTSASLWLRNSGAPSLSRWHLKQLWPQ